MHALPTIEMTPHLVAEAFCNCEVEAELGWVDYRFKKISDREECMQEIEKKRSSTLYLHSSSVCTDDCKKRGKIQFDNLQSTVDMLDKVMGTVCWALQHSCSVIEIHVQR